jgi:hypothetical protein
MEVYSKTLKKQVVWRGSEKEAGYSISPKP